MKTFQRLLPLLLSCACTLAWGQTRYLINTIAGVNSIGDNGPAAQAMLFVPTAVAVDAQRNVYIADTFNQRIRKVTPAGVITTIACAGINGTGGDGGQATLAYCSDPNGVAVDASGNVYFSDTFSNIVRKVSLDGTLSRVAGTGSHTFSGDGNSATSAALAYPTGLAFDAAGNLYIADTSNHRIRRVTPDGIISTVAGTGSCSVAGDGGIATQASLCGPLGVAVDSQGRVLIADTSNHRIRRFIPGGALTTVAGTAAGFNGDNGPATAAAISGPRGVAVDSRGVIYISDTGNQRIRMVGLDGTITTLAGSVQGFSGDGGPSANAAFNTPIGIAVDNQGQLYVSDSRNHRLRSISTARTISTLAGIGHYLGDNGLATSAVFSNPSFLALDAQGNLLVTDTDNHVIRRIDSAGRVSTLAGTGIEGNSGDGGPALSSRLDTPTGLAFDTAGNLYFADSTNQSLRMISPSGAIVKVAGGGGNLGDNGPAQSASFHNPHGIAVDAKGSIYVADTDNHRIRRIAPDRTITTLIGDGTANSVGDGGLASAATVSYPWDVKVAPDGTVYITEEGTGNVRAISPSGIVSTVAYLNSFATGLAIDSAGKVFASSGDQVFALSDNNQGTAIAGKRNDVGFAGDGAGGLQALLNSPNGMVIDSKGVLYFCDQGNNRIRKLAPDTVSQVALVSGDKQTGVGGATLPLPLVVQVNGTSGGPFPGVTVAYAINSSSGGRLSAIQTVTGADGRAGVNLTLPNAAATVTITATVTGLPPVTFTATSLNAPSVLSILGGDKQIGVVGSTLPQILGVLVLGVDRNPIAGTPVTFSVTTGSATLNPASMQTAFDGSAYTRVTLGSPAGPVTITAAVAGLQPVVFTLTSTAVNAPQIFPGGVVGAGLSSPALQSVSPNGIVSIFGSNFAADGTSRKVSGSDLVNGRVPQNLAGVCVLFGTERAPIFLVTPGQLNVQVPQVNAPGTTPVQVLTNCDTPTQALSQAVTVAVQPAAPEFFYAAISPDGRYPIAATDAVTGAGIGDPARMGPGFALAHPGQTVTIYCTGLGLTSPAFAPGQLPPAGAQVNNIAVTLDGTPLNASAIQYAGVAPMNAGLYQLNLALPLSLTPGDHTLTMSVNGSRSPSGYLSLGQ